MARSDSDPLTQLRQIVDGLPETSEKVSHGAPTFWGGRKTFACFHDGHYDPEGAVAVWFKAPDGAQEALVHADPATFYVPKYLGPRGWVGMRLTGEVDWNEVRSHLVQGYRLVAPKRAVKVLDGA